MRLQRRRLFRKGFGFAALGYAPALVIDVKSVVVLSGTVGLKNKSVHGGPDHQSSDKSHRCLKLFEPRRGRSIIR
jgi:hypothetical protein